MFFKKFTETESLDYKQIVSKTEKEIKLAYKNDLETIKTNLKEKLSKDEKKEYQNKEKQLLAKMDAEIKTLIKKRFDYQIPIAEVEKAGISTTGSVIENELEPLEEEFTVYRKANKLWENTIEEVKYEIIDESIFRMVAGEPETFYSN